jgi:hypothetical protein
MAQRPPILACRLGRPDEVARLPALQHRPKPHSRCSQPLGPIWPGVRRAQHHKSTEFPHQRWAASAGIRNRIPAAQLQKLPQRRARVGEEAVSTSVESRGDVEAGAAPWNRVPRRRTTMPVKGASVNSEVFARIEWRMGAKTSRRVVNSVVNISTRTRQKIAGTKPLTRIFTSICLGDICVHDGSLTFLEPIRVCRRRVLVQIISQTCVVNLSVMKLLVPNRQQFLGPDRFLVCLSGRDGSRILSLTAVVC